MKQLYQCQPCELGSIHEHLDNGDIGGAAKLVHYIFEQTDADKMSAREVLVLLTKINNMTIEELIDS